MTGVSKDFELSTGKVLRISARKPASRKGVIVVVASTHEVDGATETHVVYQDMYSTVLEVPCSRVTKKRLQEALAVVLEDSVLVLQLKQEAERL